MAHVFPVRIYWEDTDAGGMVYHANYLKFAERARTEMLRKQGLLQSQMLAERGVAFVVRRFQADFLASARLDDRLDVVSRVTAIGGASIGLAQDIRRDGIDLVRLQVKLAFILHGRPIRLPETLRAALAGLGTGELGLDDGTERG